MLDTKTVNSHAFCCGKTFQVYYPPRTTHSDTFWLDWFKNVSHCSQQGENGQTQVYCIQLELSRGEHSMLNTSDSPNDASACSLWQVLDPEVSPRYFLSKKAIAYLAKREVRRLPLLLQLKVDGDLTIARSLSAKKMAYDGLLRASAKN